MNLVKDTKDASCKFREHWFHPGFDVCWSYAGDVVTSRLSNGRAGITKVLQMDVSPGMLLKDAEHAKVSPCNIIYHIHIYGHTYIHTFSYGRLHTYTDTLASWAQRPDWVRMITHLLLFEKACYTSSAGTAKYVQ